MPSGVVVSHYIGESLHSFGSGICIAKGSNESGNFYAFLTVHHVIEDEEVNVISHGGGLFQLLIPTEEEEEQHNTITVFSRGDRGQTLSEVEVKKEDCFVFSISDEEEDIGLVVLFTRLDLDVEPCKLSPESSPGVAVGDTVYTVGAPAISEITFRKGMIAAIDADNDIHVDVNVYPGASGGGLFNEAGELVALIRAYTFRGNAVAIPMAKVYDFFRRNTVELPEMEKEE